jgi:threonine synthase
VQASGGFAVAVSDDEIMEGVLLLAGQAGIFVEPAAGAAVAGLVRLVREEKVRESETVVVLATGSGLKDVESVLRRSTIPNSVPADIERLPPAA